ncbi:MAG: electron transfer flavoprotein subunit beta, partial [Planctomycetota bacterium]|nr:electron transfer flavoprotein subunit beta [Planctomycetota bacterium]
DGKTAAVRRRVEGGEEIWEVRLPAVFSCDKGLNVPRLATLKGRMAAKKMQPRVLEPKDLGVEPGSPRLKAVRFGMPPARTAGRILSGEKEQSVAELVRILKEERKVL